MADLSEHFGRFGEFLVGLLGLVLLLLMLPAFRRRSLALLKSAWRFAQRLYAVADKRSNTIRRWNVALRLIFRERRDLLLILAALIAFDYFLIFHDWLVRKYILYPAAGASPGGWNSISRIAYQHHYLMMAVEAVGYALFSWLAFFRAQNYSYKSASTFKPHYLFFGFLLFVAGADLLTTSLSPGYFRYFKWLLETEVFLSALGWSGASLALIFIGAKILKSARKELAILSALAGYLALTQCLQLIYVAADIPAMIGPPWMTTAESLLSQFNYIAIWNITLVAFVVVLASPETEASDNAKMIAARQHVTL